MSSRVALILVLLAGVTASADSRTPTKSTRANMPRGFVWPPNQRMTELGEECTRALGELGVSFEAEQAAGRMLTPMSLPEATIGGITFTPVYRKHQVWDCQLVFALAQFASTLHDLGVREVKYGSAFRWSKVRVSGRTKNILSRHALGLALDIVSFVDADGNEAVVAKHYRKRNKLLLSIERAVNGSGIFRMLLTPSNDPLSHKDHFHLEANPDYSAPPATEQPAS